MLLDPSTLYHPQHTKTHSNYAQYHHGLVDWKTRASKTTGVNGGPVGRGGGHRVLYPDRTIIGKKKKKTFRLNSGRTPFPFLECFARTKHHIDGTVPSVCSAPELNRSGTHSPSSQLCLVCYAVLTVHINLQMGTPPCEVPPFLT